MTDRRNADPLWFAVAHPLRRQILDLALDRGEVGVGDLRALLDVTAPALSQHLRVLADAELIVTRKEGRHVFVRATPEPLVAVVEWMLRYQRAWASKLDRLGDWLDAERTRPSEES